MRPFPHSQDDRDSETTCFGLVGHPVNADGYKSSNCWVYRSYNGYLYANVSTEAEEALVGPDAALLPPEPYFSRQ